MSNSIYRSSNRIRIINSECLSLEAVLESHRCAAADIVLGPVMSRNVNLSR